MGYLLEVKNIQTAFNSEKGKSIFVNDVSFHLKQGETIGVVGESGSGKSLTAMSIMQLLASNGEVTNGEILFDGVNLLNLNEKEMNQVRGNKISMIFQDTMTSLNPVFTVGNQIIEAIALHLKYDKVKAYNYAVEMLKKVGLPTPERIMKEYPFALSGGMRQRVMIAMALSCKPKLLIADEPTTALDVTIQAQIIQLMKNLRDEYGTAIMLITHDIGVVAELSDRVIVMYAGEIVEEADVFTLFDNPQHPYTIGLMKSVPKIDGDNIERLASIKGAVPTNYQNITGCRFSSRCPKATEECIKSKPQLRKTDENHYTRCIKAEMQSSSVSKHDKNKAAEQQGVPDGK